MRYPAYPLITIDPYVSLWSCSDQLNDDNTRLWFGKEKPIHGVLHIDGEHLRFMGAGDALYGTPLRCLPQKSVEFEPLFTRYTFANSRVQLTVEFWSPAIITDVQLMSTPCSFIDYSIKVLDGRAHDISIELYVDSAMCGHDDSDVTGDTRDCEGYSVARFGKRRQNPLHERGDGVDIDWGILSGWPLCALYRARRGVRLRLQPLRFGRRNYPRVQQAQPDVGVLAARGL